MSTSLRGTNSGIGETLLEVTGEAHNGCAKFAHRFGKAALQFVNSPLGKELHLRGIYAKIVEAGTVRVGDAVVRLAAERGRGSSMNAERLLGHMIRSGLRTGGREVRQLSWSK